MNLKSPFRYPGGKSKIIKPIIATIISEIGQKTLWSNSKMNRFVDVFAGGGSVSMAVVNVYPNVDLVMNDLDEWMYSFWNSLTDETEYNRMITYMNKYPHPTVEDFVFLRKSISRNGLKCGYKGFIGWFFNRTTFSGIFKSGPIGGHDQTGQYKIDCRYKPEKTKKMLAAMRIMFKNRKIEVTNADFRTVIDKYKDDEDVLLYLDPPYMKQGSSLYPVYMVEADYIDMAECLKSCKCKWIVSHDNYKPFVDLFNGWTNIKSIDGVAYTINSIEGNRKTELLITKK